MRYLDEDITIDLQNISPIAESRTYPYFVKSGGVNIFIGNTYIPSGTTEVSMDITDILRSVKWQDDVIGSMVNKSNYATDVIGTYTVEVIENGTTYFSGSTEVALIYRYPNTKRSMNTDLQSIAVGDFKEYPLLQGASVDGDGNYSLIFRPRVPYVSTNKFGIGLMSELGADFGARRLFYSGIIKGSEKSLGGYQNKVWYDWFTLSSLFSGTTVEDGTRTVECMGKQAVINQIEGNVTRVDTTGFNYSGYGIVLAGKTKTGAVLFENEYDLPDIPTIYEYEFDGISDLNHIELGDESNFATIYLGNLFKKTDEHFTLSFTVRDKDSIEIRNISIIGTGGYDIIEHNNLLGAGNVFTLDVVEEGSGVARISDDYSCYVGHISNAGVGTLIAGNSRYTQTTYPIVNDEFLFELGWESDRHYEITYFGDWVNNIFCGITKHKQFGDDIDIYFVVSGRIETLSQDNEMYMYDLDITGYEIKKLEMPENKELGIISVENSRVIDVDMCPARYYVEWCDRYGSWQCQPFAGVDTFSEKFTNVHIQNYQGYKRNIDVTIQPSWKLNTGWVEEAIYPYYESIFVSPKVFIYDTQEDAVFGVILKDTSYTEKTFKNQRKFFNVQMEFELNKTQDIML